MKLRECEDKRTGVVIKVALIQREIMNDLKISLLLHNTTTLSLFQTSQRRLHHDRLMFALHIVENELFRTLTFYICQRSAGWSVYCCLLAAGSRFSSLASEKKMETNKTEHRSYPSLSLRATLWRFCHSPSDTK